MLARYQHSWSEFRPIQRIGLTKIMSQDMLQDKKIHESPLFFFNETRNGLEVQKRT